MKFAQRENTPSRGTVYFLDTMRKRKRARKRKNVYEARREEARCILEGAERLMAKEEQSQFIPRAFVNLPREHIMDAWSFQQTEMRKVGGGLVAS